MWSALRRLIAANPMGVFLWGIIAKWYILVAITSIVVLYYVAKGLDQIGFINYITTTVTDIFTTSKAIAQNCTTKLGKANWEGLKDFWDCMADPGEYNPDPELERSLNESLTEAVHQEGGTIPEPSTPVNANPYEGNN